MKHMSGLKFRETACPVAGSEKNKPLKWQRYAPSRSPLLGNIACSQCRFHSANRPGVPSPMTRVLLCNREFGYGVSAVRIRSLVREEAKITISPRYAPVADRPQVQRGFPQLQLSGAYNFQSTKISSYPLLPRKLCHCS
jgi:hypothetical protein